MNSWDVRRARIRTIVVMVRNLPYLDEADIMDLVGDVADDRYTQKRAKQEFITEAQQTLHKEDLL